MADVDVNYFN